MSHRPGLDKEVVVKAAAEMVNEQGLEGLTLNRLAAKLGVQTPSLYNHIDGLPGLLQELALLSTRSLGECLAKAAIGKSGPQALMDLAQSYRSYIKDNPGLYLASLRASRNQQPVNDRLAAAEERVVDIVLAVMASFGLHGEDALHAVRGLRSLVHGFATLELAGGFGLPLDCDESFRRLVNLLVQGLTRST
ncbi:MAG: WHG domain-containing protein [Anaerolineaceae bacterium]|nr:WHG domain-containing protein [Anaerolineaceae bacterium]